MLCKNPIIRRGNIEFSFAVREARKTQLPLKKSTIISVFLRCDKITKRRREREKQREKERVARYSKVPGCCIRRGRGRGRGGRREGSTRDRHRVHRCPAARVTGTGCNWTPITYVRAAGEIGKEKEKKKRPRD